MRKRFPALSVFLPIVIGIVFLCLHPYPAAAYQNIETTTPDPIATPTSSPEENPPAVTSTPEETSTAEPVASEEATETISTPSSETPSASVENTASPEPIIIQQAMALSGEYAPDEVLVRFRKSTSNEAIQQCLSLAGAMVLSTIDELTIWVAQVSPGKVAESIAVLSACPGVRYAEPNYRAFIADTIPSDPGWGQQYGLVNIRAPQGWDHSTGSTSVTIAILDTGVDLSHADLAIKIVPGYDFVNDDPIPQDDNGHGTHAAGIAAAIGNNGMGVAGVSWGARIMPVKVLNAGGGGFFADAADGIVWAADHGAQIINLSLGGTSPSTALQDAVNYAYGKGVLVVAAAGNDNGAIRYPARYPNVIAVGAVDSMNNRAGTSNFGPELDLVAPGVNIYSTVIGGYGYSSGTSMAAPYVSGLAAVLYGIPGNGSSALVASQMQSSARDLGLSGFDIEYGYGLIQMDAALKLALPSTATPAPSPTAVISGGNLFFKPGAPTFAWNATDTPTPTAAPTDMPATFTPLPETPLPTDPTTPYELEALSIQEERTTHVRSLPAWQVPCAGGAFLLAGLLLLWTARKKR